MVIDIWVYFWSLSSILMLYMSTLMSITNCFGSFGFLVSFEIRKLESSDFVLFQDGFGCLGPFVLTHEFKASAFPFLQKHSWNFDKLPSSQYQVFLPMNIGQLSIPLRFLYFGNALQFSVYLCFIFLFKCISKYFILQMLLQMELLTFLQDCYCRCIDGQHFLLSFCLATQLILFR